MRVAHISYTHTGGAGRAAQRANLAVRQAGCGSLLVTGDKDDGPYLRVTTRPQDAADPLRTRLGAYLRDRFNWDYIFNNRKGPSNTLFSFGYDGFDLSDTILAHAIDVFHIHWPTFFLSPLTIRRLLGLRKPVFWTLHDQWSMTGGCHYAGSCTQFETSCESCPQLTDPAGLVAASFLDKLLLYGNHPSLTVISPSTWLGECATRSRILANCRVEVVPNPIETDVFRPVDDREALRESFGIRPNDVALVFMSFDTNEHRKGNDLLLEALELLASSGEFRDGTDRQVFFLVLGQSTKNAAFAPIKTIDFCVVDDDALLRDILNLGDALVLPSREDNYPNTVLEALACGTPAIAFSVGGVQDMIADGVNGFLAGPVPEAGALADAIKRFLRAIPEQGQMRTRARESVLHRNSLETGGRRLATLYEEALSNVGRPHPSTAATQIPLGAMPVLHAPREVAIGPGLLEYPFREWLTRDLASRLQLSEGDSQADVTGHLLAPESAYPAPAAAAASQLTVALVRTLHLHHAAHAGPHQYQHHLPTDQFLVRSFPTPLGSQLVGRAGERVATAMRATGQSAFQPNGLACETALLAALLERSLDVVHFVDGELAGAILPLILRAVPSDTRRPALVATYHQPPEFLRRSLSLPVLRALDAVVVLCEAQRLCLADMLGPEKVHVIPHGVDAAYFTPPSQLRRPDGPFRLLTVGHWLRDYASTFRLAQRMSSDAADVEFHVVCHNLPQQPVSANVTLHTNVSDDDLLTLYRTCDALLLPLLDSTANNTILEAMACGLPVISTDVGGVREATGEQAAILVPQGDLAALCEAVDRLRNDEEVRVRMSVAGRARAEALSWEEVSRYFARLYREIAADRV